MESAARRAHRPKHMAGLANGDPYTFQIRALAGDQESPCGQAAVVEVGPVEVVKLISAARDAPLRLMLRTFWYGLIHVVTTP